MKQNKIRVYENFFLFAFSLMIILNPAIILAFSPVVYVDIDSPAAAPTGSSWDMAYKSIQIAIMNSSPAQEIWVADGIYYERISLGASDKLYGGFEGYGGLEETQRTQRDWTKNITIINGMGINGTGLTDKDIAFIINAHTVTMDGSTTCTLDGFTITGGKANGDYPNDTGGGIFCNNVNNGNTIANCIIENNFAFYGGGMGFKNSSPVISNCTISGNESLTQGGGIYLFGDSAPIFWNCIIGNNICDSTGGGVYSESSSTTFTNCLIFNNEAGVCGAGYFWNNMNLGFINSTISGNSSPDFGGIYMETINRSKIINTIFHQNNNTALTIYDSNPILSNCLFYGNPNSAIYHEYYGFYDDEEVDNFNADIPEAQDNVTGDPQFVDWEHGNLRTMACSAAVDQGTWIGAPAKDFDGLNRPKDIPGVGADETLTEVDIGAYEAQDMLRLDVYPPILEFEQAVNQGAIVKPVILANIGTGSIEFTTITLSGSLNFSFADLPDTSELFTCTKREAFISFDPSSIGLITGTLTVESNDPNYPEIKVSLQGEGTNELPIAGQYHTGGALEFQDVNDRVIIPDFNNFPTTAITVELWMKSSSSNGGIISYAANTPGTSNEFYIYDQSSLNIAIGNSAINTGIAVNDNEWHHVAVTWDNTLGNLRLYVDYAIAYQGTHRQGYFFQGNGTLVFAEEQDAVGGGFDPNQAYIGWLDEVRIWNYVRIEDHVWGFMHEEINGNETGLVGYWKFNNVKDSFVEDSSGDENHGTIQGKPYWLTPSPADIVNKNATVGANIDRDTVFTLSGFDADGDTLTATITQIPLSGQLYQYENGSRGVAINSVPTVVSDSEHRVIYAPPAPGKMKTDPHMLQYKVNDGFQDSVIAANLRWEFSDREINVTGGAHNFGLGLVGEAPNPAHTITISNDGSTTLTFYGNEVEMVGANPEEFIISSDTGESALTEAQSRTVDITFTPQSKGLKTSKLHISSDDLDEPVVEVAFMGFGDTRPIAGKLSADKALDFTKAEDRVITNYIANLSTDSLTVSCWLKSQGSGDGIISYAVSGRDNEILLFNQANLTFYIDNKNIATGVAFNDNDWHHMAVTWQSSDGYVNVYKDGDLASTGTLAAGASLKNGGTLVFAEDQDSVGGGFQQAQAYIGALDEVRIWNKVRTGEEIKEDMNRELAGDEPGLVGYWKLNEGEGITTYDSTPNNKNGTLSGVPAWIHSLAMGGIQETFFLLTSNDEDTTITLLGIDADWDALKAIITGIPGAGKGELYQLAAPGPVRGAKITAIDTDLTDPEMRLVYAPNPGSAYIAPIEWKVNDSLVNSLNSGTYYIIVNADTFLLDYILGKTPAPPALKQYLDFNKDGIIDIGDVVTYYMLY